MGEGLMDAEKCVNAIGAKRGEGGDPSLATASDGEGEGFPRGTIYTAIDTHLT
jgi:hypothetical protein